MTTKPKKSAEKEAQHVSAAAVPVTRATPVAQPSRIDQLEQLITREGGASIAEMAHATGWQHHSIRGALAGALRKRGLVITSEKIDGVRRYTAQASA